jgi:aspartate/methionine/tyrosine aminotransferase
MLESSLAPFLLWAKTRHSAPVDLAGSNLVHCALEDLPGARDAVALWVRNDNGYAPLVEAIARHYGVTTDRIATANGCSGANFLTVAALVSAGDHVLVERPTYDPLLGACKLIGASIERFDRRPEHGYRIDADDLARRLTHRTRLIVVTSPHNPTGALVERETLVEIANLAARVGASVLVDEVYLDAASLAADRPITAASAAGLDGPFVVTNSLTKSYGLAGLRCGWTISSRAVAERIRRTRDVVDNAGPAPPDPLAVLAFGRMPDLSERARLILTTNIARAMTFFASHPRLELVLPPTASVVFPRVAGAASSKAFVQQLLDRYGVAVAPGHFFDAPENFRLSLACAPEVLEEGLGRIAQALE